MYLANRQTQKTNTANWAGAHRLLTNRLAQAAVIQTTARSILEEGLAYDRCLVGVVTDMDGFEQLADHDVLEAGQMRRVMRTQIDVVLDGGAGVLNADLPDLAQLAAPSAREAAAPCSSRATRWCWQPARKSAFWARWMHCLCPVASAPTLPRCWPPLPRHGRWISRPI